MIATIRAKIYRLLRWSEKYTKTDMVYLSKGGSLLTIGQFIASLSSFVLSIGFANLVPEEIYGTYKYIVSIFPILAIFTLPGMNTAAARAVSNKLDGTIKDALKYRMRFALFGSGASLLVGSYYLIIGNASLAISFSIISIFLPFFETFGIYDALLQGKKDFKRSTQFFIASQIFSLILMVSAIFFTDNVIYIVITYFGSWTLTRYICFNLSIRAHILNENIDPRARSYGTHLSLMSVLTTIANYLDKILIYHFMGAAMLAQYTVATAPVEQIRSLIVRGTSILSFPKFATKNAKLLLSSINQHSIKIFLSSVILAIIYIASSSLIFEIVFPKYITSIPYTMLYALILLPTAYVLPAVALSSNAAQKQLYIFNILSSMFQISSVLIGIVTLGIWGLIIARITSKSFDWVIAYILLRDLAKTRNDTSANIQS